ncbi:hypothetical protein ASZ78_002821 [Callipepla squamata]|uniref:Mitoferrin-1 n=1 Tax=Callipepla squamata TaxID=9009 RepID=A0A226MG94_CALSU|nr:hypothetical protein ASZ78_002821 [Callipepla squamata]
MQMFNSPYKSVWHCVRTVRKTEGFGAFYRSYTTQLTMNVPFQAIHFITYEFMQERVNPRREYHPLSHVCSGAVAGAVAAAATTPLDVCKTLLNTQENTALSSLNITGHLSGMANAFRTVYQLGGIAGYFRGVQARVIYQIPSTAIAWVNIESPFPMSSAVLRGEGLGFEEPVMVGVEMELVDIEKKYVCTYVII